MIAVDVSHAAVLACIHADAFAPGDRWTAASFAGLLQMPGVFGLLDDRGGFVLGREAGGEAEILTLAVAPASRRQGIGRRLVAGVLECASGPVFLEVAADNPAALHLYWALGFEQCGRRRDYYAPGRDALVLRRECPPGFP